MTELFNERAIIFCSTRANALADGVLIDVTDTARKAGYRYPVALTHALWIDIVTIPPALQEIHEAALRLWDVLAMSIFAIRRHQRYSNATTVLTYELILPLVDAHSDLAALDAHPPYQVTLVLGPGDTGAPVFTLMRVDED